MVMTIKIKMLKEKTYLIANMQKEDKNATN